AVHEIVAQMEERGEQVQRDAFGHVRLDEVKVGDWFGKQFAKKIGADKTLVQKSGYFGRSAAANQADLDLIRAMVQVAVESALAGVSGVVGHDEAQDDDLRAIEFPRIKGGKHFDVTTPWFTEMLREIGQHN
ncbi:MAG: pyrophosphate--fructose-6-phosphate 1-phosphotransferase, partial [Candidatus Competibacteraceae bacterium]|nr:pyrophosphate--fructose-6-phosphate 1-phosphotransferase [Candidatus Competibacteraceae bacterium]